MKRCQVDSVDPDEQGDQKMGIQLKDVKSGASARYVCMCDVFLQHPAIMLSEYVRKD